MVKLIVKKNDEILFGYDTTTSIAIKELAAEICELQNLKLKVFRVAEAAADLALYGPYKPENEHGYSEEFLANQSQINSVEVGVNEKGEKVVLRPDPLGKRRGEAPLPEIAEKINQTCREVVEKLTDPLLKNGSQSLKKTVLQESLDLLRGAVIIAYPGGLPEYDPVQEELNNQEDLSNTAAGSEILVPDQISLWWASKELQPSKNLAAYAGKNEKTKLILKIQKKGQGAPVREPPLDAESQKAMMAYYYKKQEEQKKLLELAEEEPDFSSSAWSNPNALKSNFHGMGNISFRPR